MLSIKDGKINYKAWDSDIITQIDQGEGSLRNTKEFWEDYEMSQVLEKLIKIYKTKRNGRAWKVSEIREVAPPSCPNLERYITLGSQLGIFTNEV